MEISNNVFCSVSFLCLCLCLQQADVAGTPCSAARGLPLQYQDVEALLQQQARALGLNAAVLATQHVSVTLLRAVQCPPQQPRSHLLSEAARVCGLLSALLPFLMPYSSTALRHCSPPTGRVSARSPAFCTIPLYLSPLQGQTWLPPLPCVLWYSYRLIQSLPCLPLEVLWMLHDCHLLPLHGLLERCCCSVILSTCLYLHAANLARQ